MPDLGGDCVKLLGSRLRQSRRRIGLQQKEVAGKNSASFLSKVETGAALPSLATLQDWAVVLQTTPGDLLGEHLVLEAAKLTVLETDKCHAYLKLLPSTPMTKFIQQLSNSATSLSTAVPMPPPDPELEYLTAKVLDHRGQTAQAAQLAESALTKWHSPLWCIYYLSLLCQVYDKLSETEKKKQAKKQLHAHIINLNTELFAITLPEGGSLTTEDLYLLKLCQLLKPLVTAHT